MEILKDAEAISVLILVFSLILGVILGFFYHNYKKNKKLHHSN